MTDTNTGVDATLDSLRQRKRLREKFLEDESFMECLAELLELEIDGGDSAASYLQHCMREAWQKKRMLDEKKRHAQNMSRLERELQ